MNSCPDQDRAYKSSQRSSMAAKHVQFPYCVTTGTIKLAASRNTVSSEIFLPHCVTTGTIRLAAFRNFVSSKTFLQQLAFFKAVYELRRGLVTNSHCSVMCLCCLFVTSPNSDLAEFALPQPRPFQENKNAWHHASKWTSCLQIGKQRNPINSDHISVQVQVNLLAKFLYFLASTGA